MYSFSALQIAKACSGAVIAGVPDTLADSCHIDSRTVRTGGLFAAFVGKQADGHNYVELAVQSGATIVLVSDSARDYSSIADNAAVVLVDNVLTALQDLAGYQRSLMNCPIIGITGSSGKTTVKELLYGALQLGRPSSLQTVATQGNYNNELGVPLTILAADAQTEAVVVEMGMRGIGQITMLTKIARPTMGIITTIGDAHIEMLGSRENIARAKGELFEALPPDGIAIMPVDVNYAGYLRSVCKAALFTIAVLDSSKSKQAQADYVAANVDFDSEGRALAQIALPSGDKISVQLPIPGLHNLSNALLAIAAAVAVGVDAQSAINGIEKTVAADMRMQRQRASIDSAIEVDILLDCYNANPESTAASLKTLGVSKIPDGALRVAVLGDMFELGEHSAKAHKDILLLAGLLDIDLVYTFGDAYARATQDVLGDLATGKNSSDLAELRSLTDIDLLVKNLTSALTSESLVLIKGSRGMHMERIANALRAKSIEIKDEQKEDNPC
ncbi:MAG: UDP-N-acetylmuramoyl-tripeptide--D-alanyl-D-alanine ligase [Coriobacteriia bacterium]|nr:UDP-N-acetylmuramoyl-tripeptide--D-alanyl-D-alanine ligase [Coriobacteriia bacterium]